MAEEEKEKEEEELSLPVEVWHNVLSFLPCPWDALQLRQCSHELYDAVTNFHSYWYRQFCWYLIKQKKRPAMFLTGCAREHVKAHDVTCLSGAEQTAAAAHFGVHIDELPKHPEFQDGTVYWTDRDDCGTPFSALCANSSHYIYKLPDNRFDIPLAHKDYKPQAQLYIYRFLIHNYRHQRQRASHYSKTEVDRHLQFTNRTLAKHRKELARITAEYHEKMSRARKRRELLKEVSLQLKRLDSNKVFHGRKSRKYKGLGGGGVGAESPPKD